MKKLTIAIDGHASTGKSSIAKELAVSLGYTYINSGSMYRAVTLYAVENNLMELIDNNIDQFINLLNNNKIHFKFNKNYMTASGAFVQAEVWNVPVLQVGKFKIYNVEVASINEGSYLFGMSAIEKLGKVSIDLQSSRIVIDK